jgi:hypothetical protein
MANEIVKANDMPVHIDELKRLGIMLATSGYFEDERQSRCCRRSDVRQGFGRS